MFILRRVEGKSMVPTFPPGKIVFALRKRVPKIGDVVIVQHGKRELIKRITQINSVSVYVLGDNEKHSTDSRHYGWLPISAVMGVVIGGK